MRTKRMKKILYYSTTFILCLAFLYYSIIFFLDKYYLRQYNKVNKDISLVETNIIDDNTTKSSDNSSITSNTLDDYRIKYNNNDIVGKISILDTNFEMLLVQSTDNKYYLNHLVNKEKNKLGATFVDYRVDLNSSKKINIYGHNNGNNSISFNELMNYLNKSYYEQYRLIQIETDVSVNLYEVFSVQVVSNNNHMQLSFTNTEWYSYIESIISDSLYDTALNVDDIDQIITLQTCTNNIDGEFLLIHGRKINK